MKEQVKIWISVGVEKPHECSLNENVFRNYIDEQQKVGFRIDNYEQSQQRNFIQCLSIDKKRIEKIMKDKQGHFWSLKPLEGGACEVLAVSDTMNNIATQISEVWKRKVTKEHLIRNYGYNSFYSFYHLEEVESHPEVYRLNLKY